MMDNYFIIQTLGFTAGVILFALLYALTRKAARLAGKGWHGSMAAAAALLWNAGNLANYVALLSGLVESSLPCRLANAVAFTGTAWLSTSLLYMQASRWEHPWQARGSRRFLVFSYATAIVLTIGFFAAVLAPDFPVSFSTFTLGSAYNLPLHIVASLALFRNAGERTGASNSHGAYVRVMLLMLSGLAVMLILLINFAFDHSLDTALTVIAQQSSIPMALVSLIFLSKFRFADVFIKQSFTVLAGIVAAFGYHWLIVEPLVRGIRAGSRFPEAAAWIAITLLWGALLLLFPAIRRAIHGATDRWLFRRPDYRQLAQAFAQETEQIADERQLFRVAGQHIQSALEVARVEMIPRAEAQLTEDDLRLDVIPLPAGHAARQVAGEPKAEMLLPVRVSGKAEFLLMIAPGREARKLLNDELMFLASIAGHIGRRIEALQFERERGEQQLRETRLRHSLTEAELRALQAQVNPHFLFNTLNTISDLITSEPEKAELMTERLAEVFRYVLERTGINLISVAEEFDFLRTYLSIEQARFGERLRVEMTVDPQVAAAMLPSLILQPLVENAIKHGIAPKLDGGTLRISASEDRGFLRLTVEDDGAGWREAHTSNGSGIGLRNVRERLRTLYNSNATMEISTAPGSGTQIRITIPKDETQNTDRGRRSAGEIAFAEADRRAS